MTERTTRLGCGSAVRGERARSWAAAVVVAGAAALVLVGTAFGLVGTAFGEGSSDRASGEQILAALPSSSAIAQLTRQPVDEAKRALSRAAGARRAGDAKHAELLEGLALEWAETARDLVRAASSEADAGALEIAALEAGVRAERSRSLLEESMARRGRAEAELHSLTADGGAFPTAPAASTGPKAPRTKAPR